MTTDLIDGSLLGPHRDFESIKKVDTDGVEYWEARELMPLLEYAQWRNFEGVIQKARAACTTSGQNVVDHFADVSKMSELGQGGQGKVDDYKLPRYACYLIAQNGDADPDTLACTEWLTEISRSKKGLERTRCSTGRAPLSLLQTYSELPRQTTN